MPAEPTELELLYDRECPVCEYYCQRIDVDADVGKLVRIDAREDSELLDEVTSVGLDIDEGMVLKVDSSIYYGSDAINQLALRSSRRGAVNRMAYWIFRWPIVARALYPILAACRNLLLRCLKRTRIDNLDIRDNKRF